MNLFHAKVRFSMNVKNNKKRMYGSVSTEWIIGTLFVGVALFAPMGSNGQSAVGALIEGVKTHYANQSYTNSLP